MTITQCAVEIGADFVFLTYESDQAFEAACLGLDLLCGAPKPHKTWTKIWFSRAHGNPLLGFEVASHSRYRERTLLLHKQVAARLFGIDVNEGAAP